MTATQGAGDQEARRRVVDVTAPAVAAAPVVPAAGPGAVPVLAPFDPTSAEQTRREVEADTRAERRLVLLEALALAVVVLVVVVRALWLT